jgi:hypothetical protein
MMAEELVFQMRGWPETRVHDRLTADAFMAGYHVTVTESSNVGVSHSTSHRPRYLGRHERCGRTRGRRRTHLPNYYLDESPTAGNKRTALFDSPSWSSAKFASDNLPRFQFPQPLYNPPPVGRISRSLRSTDTMDKKDEDVVAVKVDRTQVFQEARVFNVSPM